MSLVGVVERRFVIGKSCFRKGPSGSNISLGWRHDVDFPDHRAVSWYPVVACFQTWGCSVFLQGWACNCS